MAQHVPIKAFTQKAFRKIEEGITKDVAHGKIYMRGSLRYEPLPEVYLENEDNAVYKTERRIPNGIVAGDNWGYFEVHVTDKAVNEIYLVA